MSYGRNRIYPGIASRVALGRWGRIEEIIYPAIFLASETPAS